MFGRAGVGEAFSTPMGKCGLKQSSPVKGNSGYVQLADSKTISSQADGWRHRVRAGFGKKRPKVEPAFGTESHKGGQRPPAYGARDVGRDWLRIFDTIRKFLEFGVPCSWIENLLNLASKFPLCFKNYILLSSIL